MTIPNSILDDGVIGSRTEDDPRWEGVTRPYSADDVERLRGTLRIEYTVADRGARKLWTLLKTRDAVRALGALTGGQAVQMVRAGLDAISPGRGQAASGRSHVSRPEPVPGR